jgi:hypothetical protein
MYRPDNIKTKVENVAVEPDELIMFLGQPIYIVIQDTGYGILTVACSKIHDLPFYAAEFGITPKYAFGSNLFVLRVFVLDQENLPYEVGVEEKVFMIYSKWEKKRFNNFDRFDSMEKATEKIELVLYSYTNTSIDDFVILVGRELSETIKQKIVNNIKHWISVKNGH